MEERNELEKYWLGICAQNNLEVKSIKITEKKKWDF